MLMKIDKAVRSGMKDSTSFPDVVSENIDTADLGLYTYLWH